MDLSFYTSVIILGCFACGIMIIAALGNIVLPKEKRDLFIGIFAGVIAGSLFEWGAKMLDGVGGAAVFAVVVLKLCEFIVAPGLAVLYTAVFYPTLTDVRLVRAFKLLTAHAALELILAPFGVVFYVDADGVYHHGVAYAIYIIAYVASALFLLVETKRCSVTFQARNRALPWLTITLVLTGVVVQMADDTAHVVWLSMAMASMLFYLFYCAIIQQSDSVTRLLNRYSFDSAMQILSRPAVVIFFDVDDFKRVNDSFGHAIGDQVLAIIGHALFETFSKQGSCYRIGGDEFCAIVYSDAARAHELEAELDQRLAEARREMPILPTVSAGGAIYDPATSDLDEVKRLADARMYEVKRAKKLA